MKQKYSLVRHFRSIFPCSFSFVVLVITSFGTIPVSRRTYRKSVLFLYRPQFYCVHCRLHKQIISQLHTRQLPFKYAAQSLLACYLLKPLRRSVPMYQAKAKKYHVIKSYATIIIVMEHNMHKKIIRMFISLSPCHFGDVFCRTGESFRACVHIRCSDVSYCVAVRPVVDVATTLCFAQICYQSSILSTSITSFRSSQDEQISLRYVRKNSVVDFHFPVAGRIICSAKMILFFQFSFILHALKKVSCETPEIFFWSLFLPMN